MVFHFIKITSLPTKKSLNISTRVFEIIVGRKMSPPQGTSQLQISSGATRETMPCEAARVQSITLH